MTAAIRLAAWNMAHQTKYKALPENLFDALKCLDADVIVLSEVVLARKGGRDNRAESLEAAFADQLGMKLFFPNATRDEARDGFRNHTLIASRLPAVQSDLRMPVYLERGTNFLHVRLPEHDLEIAGVRVPYWPQRSQELRDFWTWFESLLADNRSKGFVAIGDLNVDMSTRRNKVARDALERILMNGWHLPVTKGGDWSYIARAGNKTLLDHAILSDGLRGKVSYVDARDGHTFASNRCDMSDHSVLLLEVRAGPSRSFT